MNTEKPLVELTCMVCGKDFMGPEPVMCCSGKECGCKGMPVEPVVCSEECYEKIGDKPIKLKTMENNK